MEATKKTTAKKKLVNDDFIIEKYMNWVLEKNETPKNVFLFCKEIKIVEADFYSFFGSLDGLRNEIWVKFFENTINTLHKEKDFESYTDKNKLLTMYFTLFEILTLNRSYVIFDLTENDKRLIKIKNLKGIRTHLKNFVKSIEPNETSEIKEKFEKISKPIYSEGAWIQFLFLLKFWLDDNSKSFEKTDILIEKSVNTIVDLLNTKPLESLFDLGKFLWKEKMN